ncbi:Disease resistance protein (TIR-NBS-LRR class) family [Arabidopsis thaliana]|uniref:ADP-ribosyl cyclase/cyclic ADP-ribose hydrolase n=1 Tax=Arabidopsis thaliana TaxID=3702 RepID=A0A1P8B713_ARATH|nr:Disease resistance protein (TIR-NBS-LRR class) family [Arabidopsis thaliana]ANM67383.1 Disease resistance protein (TIR-NBS-LRR class) family [Arabidopsis thaliana]|eukprot:NP_001329216.1 Disease resistance protein (TIR-NBS-LRR class) family [Arabidopsis thaliana]
MASSSSHNWVYDVFTSFSGEDIRVTFLTHFLKELDRKMIIAFKDNEIERGNSIGTELIQAIKDSRIAVVVFSKKYSSSSWCLNELVEIVNCKEIVIPVFYDLDPSDVRKQEGEFGESFKETCKNRTDYEIQRWGQALTNVANIAGYHTRKPNNEAKLIEEITNDVLDKLMKLTPSKDFDEFFGIEDHIKELSLLLCLESEEVRMVGIWGPTGIGKTTIARALFNRIYRHFQGRVFIDRAFISKSMAIYSRANSDDYNLKLHLQEKLLSKLLDKKNLEINHLDAVKERLRQMKVLIFIDDLDDQVVLEALACQTQWFGHGSRIIVITKDKHLLRAYGIDHIYEVLLPSKDLAIKMFCRSAFRKDSPPNGFIELAYDVVKRAGSLPLGLNILGSYLRGRSKEDWIDMMPGLRNKLDGKIQKTLRVSYDGLASEDDQAIFRHIACIFNFEACSDIKKLLEDSGLNVTNGLINLVDKSLIRIEPKQKTVEMHCLLQETAREIIRAQSFDDPGKREFLVDGKDIADVLDNCSGTRKVLGISLDMDEIEELHLQVDAFKKMLNLRFLKLYTNTNISEKEDKLLLPKEFNYLPNTLRLLSWQRFPMRCMPSDFFPKYLVKLLMPGSKLEKLWDGVMPLQCLKNMNLFGSENLKEFPNLSLATNLETLSLGFCLSLVEVPSTIGNLNKLTYLNMSGCHNLEKFPADVNLKSLSDLVLNGCSRLKIFPAISSNISELCLNSLAVEEFPSNLHLENLVYLLIWGMTSVKLWDGVKVLTSLKTMHLRDSKNLKEIPDLSMASNLLILNLEQCISIVELPSSIRNLHNLIELDMSGCTNLETFPTGINLQSLKRINLARCSRLKIFPDISTNISELDLSQTAIEEVPLWIENFSKLKYLIMGKCNMLEYVFLNISKLKHLKSVDFSDCGILSKADMYMLQVPNEASSSLPINCVQKAELIFINCYKLNQKALIRQQFFLKKMILPGEEVPFYFTHQTIGSSIGIPLLHILLSQQYFRFKACVVVDPKFVFPARRYHVNIQVSCRFKGIYGNYFDYADQPHCFSPSQTDNYVYVFDCCFPLNKDNAPLAELDYDHVDIEFHLDDNYNHHKIKGCGIRLSEDDESSDDDDDLSSETDYSDECEDSDDSDLGNEIDYSEDYEDRDTSDLGNETDYSEEYEDHDSSDLGNEYDYNEECEENDDNDLVLETDHNEECQDNDVEKKRSSKRMRIM